MRRALVTFVLLLTWVLSLGSQPGISDPHFHRRAASGAAYPSTSIISDYKLNESSGNAADQVGGNTLANNNTVTYSAGKLGNAANFASASSQSLSITSASLRPTAAFTINCWVNMVTLPSFAQTMEIVDNFQFNASGFQLACIHNTVTQNFTVTVYNANNTGVAVADPSVATTGSWIMLTATWDSTTIKLYKNGSLVNSAACAGPLGAYAPPSFSVGSGYGNMYLNGGVDELVIWSRALSSTEVTTLYNGNAGSTYP